MSYPNLVLAGTPKSGTSSLFKWLVSHPEITPISMNETYYLLDKNNPYLGKYNYHVNNMDAYNSETISQKKRILLEYCTHYMYQKTAMDVFSEFKVQPYIIFLLRQPSIRTFSSFSFSKNNKLSINQNFSFADFIDLLFQDNLDEIQNNCLTEKSFFARKMEISYSQYYNYLVQWVKKIPKNRIKVILFEDLVKSPKIILQSICQDLKIDSYFYDEYSFMGHNNTTKVKNKWAHKNFLYLKSIVPKNKFSERISNAYWNIQKDSSSLEKIDPAIYSRLNKHFDPYNIKLAQEFNLNLDLW